MRLWILPPSPPIVSTTESTVDSKWLTLPLWFPESHRLGAQPTCSMPYISFDIDTGFYTFQASHNHLLSPVTYLDKGLQKAHPLLCLQMASHLELSNHHLQKTDSLFHMPVIWSRTFFGSHCLWKGPQGLLLIDGLLCKLHTVPVFTRPWHRF